MGIRYYDEEELARRFGVGRRSFHRKIKPLILADFKEELSEKNIDNPDILLDEQSGIYLADSSHHVVIDTKLNIKDYSDEQ